MSWLYNRRNQSNYYPFRLSPSFTLTYLPTILHAMSHITHPPSSFTKWSPVRRLIHVLFASLAFGIVINFNSFKSTFTQHRQYSGASALLRTSSTADDDTCPLIKVNRVQSHPSSICSHLNSSYSDSILSCWQLHFFNVTDLSISSTRFNTDMKQLETLDDSKVTVLRTLDGCNSVSSCSNNHIKLLNCSYGVEDPSDVLWLRAYAETSKFVVLFNIGLSTLFYFVLAIIVDGSIFYPHRQGISISSASIMILIALASLFYILIIPTSLQFSLYGDGILNSLGYIITIILLALSLPALAVIWLSSLLFFIFFLGFLAEFLFILLLAIGHFILTFMVYQITNIFLHVRLIYFPDDEAYNNANAAANANNNDQELGLMNNNNNADDDNGSSNNENSYDVQVLSMGQSFLRSIRSNWFIARIPRILEDRALQLTQNNMPDHVHEQLFRSNVPHVDFDDLTDDDQNQNNNNNSNNNNENNSSDNINNNLTSTTTNSTLPSIAFAQQRRQNTDNNNNNQNEATPLLQIDSS